MKTRSGRRTVCSILGATLALLVGPAVAKAQDGHPQKRWLRELSAAAAWLPGGGAFRSAYFLGISANYGAFSIGGEFSRYQLSLHDEVRDENTSYGVWELFPLVLGLHFDVAGVPLRVGGDAAVGVGVGETVKTGGCASRNYTPLVLRGRVRAQYVSGSFGVGPFVGYAHNFGGSVGEDCDIGYNGPDPDRREYPDAAPFGVEAGISAGLRF
ncbi:MAG: hypothetical protein H6718_07950 [Polyangiaceae bacterium]|nr:hypothetical protein [Myxococcales bacterium]MCB9585315.1 hypothetical protein [Polyangiaceae bacterium]MCB9606668.1 hypothetical protein [Polyangiaceae bacterium]